MADLSMSPPARSGLLPDPLAGFPFAADWVTGAGKAREFLPRLQSPDDWTEVLARKEREVASVPPEAIAEIQEYNRAWGNPRGAELAARLAQPGALAVVTGQQPNLLAAPLYNLLKALSAGALARRLSALRGGGAPVVPVFWVASDDHDFHELRDCRMQTPGGELRNLGEALTRGGAPEGSPAYEWTLDEDTVRTLVRQCELLLPGGENAAARELIRTALSVPGSTFESVFCRTLAALLGEDSPMVFVAPRMAWMRRAQRPLLRSAMEGVGNLPAMLDARGAEMAAAGYPPFLHRDADVLNAFYLQGRERLRLVRRGETILAENPVTRAAQCRFSPSELLSELDGHPERFSPNVITRPLLQDSVLPTVAYVGGPGEISYLAQLGPVYEAFGVSPAVVTLRASATLIPASTADQLRGLGVSARGGDRQNSGEASLEDLVKACLLAVSPSAAPLLRQAHQLRESMEEQIRSLWSAAEAASLPHLEPSLRKTAHSIGSAVEKLEERLWRQIAAEGGESWTTFCRATALLQVAGPPQERTLAPHQFLTGYEHVSNLAAELSSKLDWTDPRPQVVTLGEGMG